jgi:hypothetical protein
MSSWTYLAARLAASLLSLPLEGLAARFGIGDELLHCRVILSLRERAAVSYNKNPARENDKQHRLVDFSTNTVVSENPYVQRNNSLVLAIFTFLVPVLHC